MTDRFFVLVD